MSTITLKELSKATRMKLRFSVPQVGGVVKGKYTMDTNSGVSVDANIARLK